jgi:ribosomal protein S6E (S10)
MPSFTTKAAIASSSNIRDAKRANCLADPTKTYWYSEAPWRKPNSWRGSTIAKRISAKAERKQAKLDLRNH